MSRRVVRSAEAEEDLIANWRYIADDPAAADRMLDWIDSVCTLLADFPGVGIALDDLRPGLCMHEAGNYLVFYRPMAAGVEIVRVIHHAPRRGTNSNVEIRCSSPSSPS
jgi:toxin ParE1/3/4